jgi:hypothetical protein
VIYFIQAGERRGPIKMATPSTQRAHTSGSTSCRSEILSLCIWPPCSKATWAASASYTGASLKATFGVSGSGGTPPAFKN